MIVDTGSKNYELSQTQRRFISYGQKDPLNFKGHFNAAIRVGDKTVNSKAYVIEGNAESLLGRDSSFKLDSLLKEYDDVFQGLGF